jgi:plastocyanin
MTARSSGIAAPEAIALAARHPGGPSVRLAPMHAAVLQLAPILGAEKSKVPFYIAGGLLVAWALIVSLGLGMRIEGFPRTKDQQRGIIAVTVVLVLAAVGTAVITSGGSLKSATPTASSSSQAPASGGTPTSSPATPTATTGTPAPPSSPASGTSSTSLQLAANPEGQLSYSTKQLSAKAGRLTIAIANMSPVEHNVTVARGSTVEGATPTFKGGSKTLTLNLKPGTYTFFCSVPGHRQAGMEGTLTVS